MSLKLVFLATAAALIASPIAASAQITGSRVNPGVRTDPPVQAAREQPDEQAETTEAAADQAQGDADAVDADSGGGTEAETAPAAAITAAEVQVGAHVHDTDGGMVGTIESVDAEGAVIATGSVRAKLPFGSFGKNDRGLVISLTRAELEAAARAESPG